MLCCSQGWSRMGGWEISPVLWTVLDRCDGRISNVTGDRRQEIEINNWIIYALLNLWWVNNYYWKVHWNPVYLKLNSVYQI